MMFPFAGGGDYLNLYGGAGGPELPAGAGDVALGVPTRLGGSNDLRRIAAAIPFTLSYAHNFAPVVVEDSAVLVGEEGGYYLELSTTVENYFQVTPEVLPHTIKLIDVDGQSWPLTEPACYGGVPTLAYVLIPRSNGTVLRFATPRAPEGAYTIQVARPDGWTITTAHAVNVRVIPAAFSREVTTVRSMFPSEVYNPYPD
jgi:hypothetical protein